MEDSMLSQFHDKEMDGLIFCKKVYALFDKIAKDEQGGKRLRLRQSKTEKKLVEELLPISWFVKNDYSYGRKNKVKWVNGNQTYDAHVVRNGVLVDPLLSKESVYIEATMAVHKKDYLQREHITENGLAHGVRGMTRDRKTGKTVSVPMVICGYQPEFEFVELIKERIYEKSKKKYPENTVLIIQCQFDTVFMKDIQWFGEQVNKAKIQHRFTDIYLIDSSHYQNTMLQK